LDLNPKVRNVRLSHERKRKGNHTNAHHAEIFAKWKEISSLKLSGVLNLPNNGDTQLVEAEFHYY